LKDLLPAQNGRFSRSGGKPETGPPKRTVKAQPEDCRREPRPAENHRRRTMAMVAVPRQAAGTRSERPPWPRCAGGRLSAGQRGLPVPRGPGSAVEPERRPALASAPASSPDSRWLVCLPDWRPGDKWAGQSSRPSPRPGSARARPPRGAPGRARSRLPGARPSRVRHGSGARGRFWGEGVRGPGPREGRRDSVIGKRSASSSPRGALPALPFFAVYRRGLQLGQSRGPARSVPADFLPIILAEPPHWQRRSRS
jgi:hypothetical protein